MNRKIILKRILDVVMIVLLLVLMSFQYTGAEIHEWVGTGMFLAVLIHQFMNRKWYAALGTGKFPTVRVLQIVINFALVLDTILMMVTGMLMSGYVFQWLPVHTGLSTARSIHLAGAHWGFLLMSMHMGMHFGIISSVWKKTSKGNKRQAVLKLLLLIVFGYGIVAFIQQGIGSYLFLQTEFYQWGKAPNVLVYNLQNICMMITAGVIIRILCLSLKKKSR